MRLLIVIAIVSIVKANIYYDMNNDSYEDVKNSRNFTGKVVLVTGSSSGIGEGTVKLFSILGAKVVITGRNATNIKSVAEEVHKLSPHGLKPLEVVSDLTKSEDVKRLIDSTIKEYGKLDILVNNAGQLTPSSIKHDTILDEFDKIFNINVRSIVELIHIALPYIQKTNGTIINISSIAGLHPRTGSMTYAMAKTALDMMTKILAIELGPSGIRVNSIKYFKWNPGVTETPIFETSGSGLTKEILDKVSKLTPLKRIGQPLDIAKGVAFLASTDAQFITGANLGNMFANNIRLIGLVIDNILPGLISPGLTITNMSGVIPKEYLDITEKYTPLRRNGQPLDIAKGVAFLASTDAQFITGANLVIDGGLVYNMHPLQ